MHTLSRPDNSGPLAQPPQSEPPHGQGEIIEMASEFWRLDAAIGLVEGNIPGELIGPYDDLADRIIAKPAAAVADIATKLRIALDVLAENSVSVALLTYADLKEEDRARALVASAMLDAIRLAIPGCTR